MRAFIFQQILVNFNVDTTIKDSNLEISQVGAEPFKLMAYLQERLHKYLKLEATTKAPYAFIYLLNPE